MSYRAWIRGLVVALSIACATVLAPIGIAAADGALAATEHVDRAPSQHPHDDGGHVLGTPEAAALKLGCNTTIDQPGGVNTTIYVYYNNCGPITLFLAPSSHAVSFDGTYTYANRCRTVPGHTTYLWIVDPSAFPPVPTNNWSLTNCMTV
jgi:hypothetical protein